VTPLEIAALEKVELHCHSDGLIDAELMPELASIIPVRSMAAWNDGYNARVGQRPYELSFLSRVLELQLSRWVSQRVSYAELMVSGLLKSASVVEDFRSLSRVLDRAAPAIEVSMLVAIGRGSVARAERQAEVILELAREKLIAGVALAGDERACTVKSIAHVFARFREAGLGIEIHAGETAGPESVWDAIEHGAPQRIGHGVRAFEDARLVEALIARKIHLEFCPTSNLCLGVVRAMSEHPIARARALGMSFSVSTDDPGPFGCSMNSELAMLARELGFGADDFAKIREDSLQARFKRAS